MRDDAGEDAVGAAGDGEVRHSTDADVQSRDGLAAAVQRPDHGEGGEVEVRAQLTVEPAQEVQVETGGDPLRVVVGSSDDVRRILFGDSFLYGANLGY